MSTNAHGHGIYFGDMVPHVDTLCRYAESATTILELGVRTGVSTWAMLDGLPEGGAMVSVDIDRRDLPERITRDTRWSMIVADDRDISKGIGLPHETVDLVFIDTSHEYHHTLEELYIADGMEAEVILLHDYALPDVRDAVTGFVARNPNYRIEMVEPSQWELVALRRCQ